MISRKADFGIVISEAKLSAMERGGTGNVKTRKAIDPKTKTREIFDRSKLSPSQSRNPPEKRGKGDG